MPELRRFVCIVCPRGCALEAEVEDAGGRPSILALRGYSCPRGEDYGRRELLDPRRVLTSTVRARGLALRRLPVRSSGELPRDRLVEAARALDSVTVERPVRRGELVVANILGLGVDMVAADDLGA